MRGLSRGVTTKAEQLLRDILHIARVHVHVHIHVDVHVDVHIAVVRLGWSTSSSLIFLLKLVIEVVEGLLMVVLRECIEVGLVEGGALHGHLRTKPVHEVRRGLVRVQVLILLGGGYLPLPRVSVLPVPGRFIEIWEAMHWLLVARSIGCRVASISHAVAVELIQSTRYTLLDRHFNGPRRVSNRPLAHAPIG